MLKKCLIVLVLFSCTTLFSQETNSNNQTASTNDFLSLKLKGTSAKGGIAVIVSNMSPVFNEIRDVVARLIRDDYRIALVPKNYDYDVPTLSATNSPFAPEIKYIIKIHVLTETLSEQLIKTKIEMLRLSDNKYVIQDYAVARPNIAFFVGHLKRMLEEIIPQENYVNPKIINVQADQLTFSSKEFPGLRRGDEIKVRYNESRQGITESIAIVSRFSNEFVIAKDISKKVQSNDVVLRHTPKRNRFYINLGAIIPTLGESTLIAKLGDKLWQENTRWPAGFKVEGEYERFLPYQLVSTTAFGINVDRTLYTYLMTGIGYRILINPFWEVTPYFRLGVAYNSLGLYAVSGTSNHLQGFSLSIGMALGANIVRRLGENIFIGTDLGVQYYPFTIVNVLSGTETVTPQWKHGDTFSDKFSMTQLFPYISIKIGWMF